MTVNDLLGTTITQVYCVYGLQDGWLDTADCFIELDGALYAGVPFVAGGEAWLRELPADAVALFRAGDGSEPVLGRKLADFLWRDDDAYGGYFLLDDGTLIGEERMAPHGTGQAGLHLLQSEAELATDGSPIRRLTAGDPDNR